MPSIWVMRIAPPPTLLPRTSTRRPLAPVSAIRAVFGMDVLAVLGGEGHGEPALGGDGERVAQAHVVGGESEDARDQGTVRAVPAVGLGERAEQRDVRPRGGLAQKLERDAPQARGAGRMRARGPDHDRPDDIQHVGHVRPPFMERPPGLRAPAADRSYAP